MVELRKRPPPKETSEPAAKRSASKPRSTVKKVIDKAKAVVTDTTTPATSTTAAAAVTEPAPEIPATGQIPETVGAGTAAAPAAQTTAIENETTATATIPLSTSSIDKSLPSTSPFDSSTTLTLHTGSTTTFSTLLSQSTNGIIIFTYPKASTPGCTTQACLFRDNYTDLREQKGYSVFGLSNDSVKANNGFVTKQGLGYELICDPDAVLSGGLGMKKPGPAKGCVRGVVVISKDGVVRVWMQGGPGKTMEAVREFVGN